MFKKLTVSCFLMCAYASEAFASEDSHAAPSGGGHHESSGGLPQLDPSTYASQTFWLLIVLAFMYVFFARKSLPEISQTIENRSERIRNDLDSAAKLKDEVASVQAAYEEGLEKARDEASALFQKFENDIKVQSEKNTKEFQDRASEKTTALEKNIEAARKAAMQDMSNVAAEVATEAAEKIIGVRADQSSAIAVVKSLSKAA